MSVLANSIQQNTTENRGVWTCAAGVIPTSTTAISPAGYDICACLVPNHLAALPFDPLTGSYTDCTTYDTGYTISRDPVSGRVTVSAAAELGASISVTQ